MGLHSRVRPAMLAPMNNEPTATDRTPDTSPAEIAAAHSAAMLADRYHAMTPSQAGADPRAAVVRAIVSPELEDAVDRAIESDYPRRYDAARARVRDYVAAMLVVHPDFRAAQDIFDDYLDEGDALISEFLPTALELLASIRAATRAYVEDPHQIPAGYHAMIGAAGTATRRILTETA
jgi:hypothetical protein